MTLSVNLLPWRHLQRQQRRRFRICIISSLLVLLMGSFCGMWFLFDRQLVMLQQHGHDLENQQRKLQDMLQQQGEALIDKRQPPGGKQRSQVSRWEGILAIIASKLPENSWLRMIGWQSDRLKLEGYTSEIGDLEKIETLLKQFLVGFQVKAGPVSYQGAQGLAYTFTLEETGGALVLP